MYVITLVVIRISYLVMYVCSSNYQIVPHALRGKFRKLDMTTGILCWAEKNDMKFATEETCDEWMNDWMNERTNERTNECMNEWINESMNEWNGEGMIEQMNDGMMGYAILIHGYRSKLGSPTIGRSIITKNRLKSVVSKVFGFDMFILTHTHILTNSCPILRSILQLPSRVSLLPLLLSSKKSSKCPFLRRM